MSLYISILLEYFDFKMLLLFLARDFNVDKAEKMLIKVRNNFLLVLLNIENTIS